MADTALQVVVSPLLGVVFEKLRSPLLKQFGVKKDLEKLSRTTSVIKNVLEDAEQKQIHDATTKDWLRKLKEIAYEADDVIEECIGEALFSRNSEIDYGSCSTQVCHSFCTYFNFKRLNLRSEIAKRIKRIGEKFDEIAEERKFHLNERPIEGEPVEDFGHYRETSSEVLEDFVYGRDMVNEKIVGILLNNSSIKDNVLVYSVIGMGGLGKTTLAQCVYKDTRVETNFHVRIWVCVSEVFRANKIIKTIIESVSGKKCDLDNLDALQGRLKDLLTGIKFLLVLDDVWNEDLNNWDKIKFPLRCGATGSSIIVTTRSTEVAQMMGTLPMNQHKLAPLSDEECWYLFKGRAFDGEVIENSELEGIGKVIVKKCRGVPLAAKALGGSLRSERNVNVWKSISTSEIWELREDGFNGGIFASLSLSYNRLSGGMKECFSYCSIFPKDHRINIAELIQLWMANGLVQSKGTLELEDVGRRIFNTLLWKSFFQDVERDNDGKLVRCKMHDLMHDLACYAAKDECVYLNHGDLAEIPNSIRHLSTSLGRNPNSNILRRLNKSHPLLRTFIQMEPYPIHHKPNSYKFFESLRCLRVLDLSYSRFKFIPSSIREMKHLRYLDLSYNSHIVCLPLSLSDLKTLQTLKLRKCSNLKRLSKKMNNLVSLIHLDLYGCYSLTEMRIGELVGLRTLGRFVVGRGNGPSIKDLGKLDKLEGELDIEVLKHVKNATDARVANLSAKTNLVDVSFTFHATLYSPEQGHLKYQEEVLEALQPHSDLSGILSINWYRGSRFSSWIQNLKKLSMITLTYCYCEYLPPLGHLPFLKLIRINRMECLKRINKEFYGTSSQRQNSIFPSLLSLHINSLSNLEEWEALDVDDTHVLFPEHCTIHVFYCPKLVSLPSALVQDLHVTDCENLVVRSLPYLRHLKFDNCSSIPVGSLQNLEALKSLNFKDCKFSSIPQQQLTSLKSLEITNCHSLTSLSQSLQHLSSLHTLSIKDCKELEFSSADFQHLLALQTLHLSSLPKLISLPEIPTLQTLEICSCRDLKVLPQWFRNLTSLQTLQIYGCGPDLESKCKKDIGEYWPYISHIPNLHIR